MRILFRLGLTLILSFGVIVGTVRSAANRSPALLALLFSESNGELCLRPCLLGIQPGEKSFTQALKLLYAHPFTHTFKPNLPHDVFSNPAQDVILTVDDQLTVIAIDLVNHTETSLVAQWTSFEQMLNAFGQPDRVEWNGKETRSY